MGELTNALSTKDERRTRRRENENMPAAKKVAGPAHPPYEKMVKAALVALKDRTGSSTQAIAKSLSRFLKKFVESGKLVKVKASYKLGSLKTEPKPKKKKVVKKKAPKKKVAKKKAPKKTTAPKKKVAKKPKKPKKKVVKKKK